MEATKNAGPSPHENCLAEETFVDDVRGGVLETERGKQTRREEGQWCRDMDVWEPVLRKDMDAERAKAVSLRSVETDKGDADRPHSSSRLVVREIRKAIRLTVRKRRRASELLRCTTSTMHTSVEYQCDECLWNSQTRKKRHARENGPDLEYVGVLKKCTYGTVDANERWKARWQILKEHGFVQVLSNLALFVQVERDVRLPVYGDDFMVRCPLMKRNGS